MWPPPHPNLITQKRWHVESRDNTRFREAAAAADQREEEKRLIVYGMFTDMTLKKADTYNSSFLRSSRNWKG